MSNVSLKEQLQAVAGNFTKTDQIDKSLNANNNKKIKEKYRPKTNSFSEEMRPRWLEYVLYGLELLKLHFPHCFKEGQEISPLKIGIKQDLVKYLSGINTVMIDDKACMLKSLVYYVNTMTYYRSVIEGCSRIDLLGQPAGIVTKEEAQYSKERKLLKQNGRHKKLHSDETAKSKLKV